MVVFLNTSAIEATPGQDGNHSVAVAGVAAALDEDEVPVLDMVLDHRLAVDFEGVGVGIAYEIAEVQSLRIGKGLNGCTGGNPPEQRHFQTRRELGLLFLQVFGPKLKRTALVESALDVLLGFERQNVLVDRRQGGQV